jgi:hypothetical protein
MWVDLGRGRRALSARIQSVEDNRCPRRHPHQLGCGLAQLLADDRRTLAERRIKARTKRRYGSFYTAVKLVIQTS